MNPVMSSTAHLTPLYRLLQTRRFLNCLRFAYVVYFMTCFAGINGSVFSAEPRVTVRQGLQLYSKEDYEAAREKFAEASEELDKQKSAAAAIAAFDEACASHRKGDTEKARDAYLRAGLSQDRSIATSAHFNLGNLSAEQARSLAGEKPELVPTEKRTEILDHLKQAIAAYRHCLELLPEHTQARRNLELVRQWIKYYTDQWNEHDRQKRRDESNLLVFLEYLIQTQTALRDSVKRLPTPVHSDALAELKRLQDELHEEIPTLREKIGTELRPKDPQGGATAAPSSTLAKQLAKQLDEGIALLQSWADAAGHSMTAAAARLGEKETSAAVNEQQAVLNELDKIWEAVIPFHPLLAKQLAEQTSIARSLTPESSADDNQPATPESTAKTETKIPAANKPETPSTEKPSTEKPSNTPPAASHAQQPLLEDARDDLKNLMESQEKALRKTRLLAPKAEAELGRLETAPPAPAPTAPASKDDKSKNPSEPQTSPQPDPEQVKAGYRKAIELAPKAVEHMEAAVKSMQQQDRQNAGQRAEEARKILEEIQKAQPKNEQQDQKQDQQKQDQQKNDEPKNDEQKKDNESQSDEQKQQEQKNEEQKQENKKDEEKKKADQKDQKQDKQEQQSKQQQGQVSPDRIEDALRKVRERQQAKRERDRKLKGQVLGRVPVDKDW